MAKQENSQPKTKKTANEPPRPPDSNLPNPVVEIRSV